MKKTHDYVHYLSNYKNCTLQRGASRKEHGKETRKAPGGWEWEPHLRPLYSLFAQRILRELGDYRGILLAGLPEPEPIEDPSPLLEDASAKVLGTLAEPLHARSSGPFPPGGEKEH